MQGKLASFVKVNKPKQNRAKREPKLKKQESIESKQELIEYEQELAKIKEEPPKEKKRRGRSRKEPKESISSNSSTNLVPIRPNALLVPGFRAIRPKIDPFYVYQHQLAPKLPLPRSQSSVPKIQPIEEPIEQKKKRGRRKKDSIEQPNKALKLDQEGASLDPVQLNTDSLSSPISSSPLSIRLPINKPLKKISPPQTSTSQSLSSLHRQLPSSVPSSPSSLRSPRKLRSRSYSPPRLVLEDQEYSNYSNLNSQPPSQSNSSLPSPTSPSPSRSRSRTSYSHSSIQSCSRSRSYSRSRSRSRSQSHSPSRSGSQSHSPSSPRHSDLMSSPNSSSIENSSSPSKKLRQFSFVPSGQLNSETLSFPFLPKIFPNQNFNDLTSKTNLFDETEFIKQLQRCQNEDSLTDPNFTHFHEGLQNSNPTTPQKEKKKKADSLNGEKKKRGGRLKGSKNKPKLKPNQLVCACCFMPGELILCQKCKKQFHPVCSEPLYDKEQKDQWVCVHCLNQHNSPIKCSYSVFTPFISSILTENPTSFSLPDTYKMKHFEDIKENLLLKGEKKPKSFTENSAFCSVCSGSKFKENLLYCQACAISCHPSCITEQQHQPVGNKWLCPLHCENRDTLKHLQVKNEKEKKDDKKLSEREIKMRFFHKVSSDAIKPIIEPKTQPSQDEQLKFLSALEQLEVSIKNNLKVHVENEKLPSLSPLELIPLETKEEAQNKISKWTQIELRTLARGKSMHKRRFQSLTNLDPILIQYMAWQLLEKK